MSRKSCEVGGKFGCRVAARVRRLYFVLVVWLLIGSAALAAQTFTVATYNLENYIETSTPTRMAKPAQARAKVRESIRTMNADVIGLQEVGGTNALLELRASLKLEGLDYPHWELVSGFDTNIQVAVLSKLPIVARRSHTQEGFLLDGRRFRMTRGIIEVDLQANPNYTFTLMVAHLKSRRPVPAADEADLREQEGLILREKIEARLRDSPNANLVVIGDLNDVKDAKSTRAVIGRGKLGLVDTRPAERNGDSEAGSNSRNVSRNVTWTHFYGKEDMYSRIDFLLLSPGLAREWVKNETYVLALPNWGVGSDHRPIVATFEAEDK